MSPTAEAYVLIIIEIDGPSIGQVVQYSKGLWNVPFLIFLTKIGGHI